MGLHTDFKMPLVHHERLRELEACGGRPVPSPPLLALVPVRFAPRDHMHTLQVCLCNCALDMVFELLCILHDTFSPSMLFVTCGFVIIHFSLKILARLMTAKFLHTEIREKGGAYGGGAKLSRNGIFTFYSYR